MTRRFRNCTSAAPTTRSGPCQRRPAARRGALGRDVRRQQGGFTVVPPLTLGFLRVALGGAALYAVVRANGDSVDAADYRGFAVLGAAVLGERVGARRAVGIAVALVGTVFVLADQYHLAALVAGTGASLLGVGLLVVESFCWAGYTVRGVPLVRRYSGLTAATYSTLAAIPMLAAVELLLRRPPLGELLSAEAVFAVLYLGFAATAAAWVLWYRGLETLPAGTVAAFFFAQPVVGAALGATLLGETLGPLFGIGGVVMAAGVWLVSTARA